MTRLKLAELTSGVGTLVLGLGLGALFPERLGQTAGLITFVGVALHAFGDLQSRHEHQGCLPERCLRAAREG